MSTTDFSTIIGAAVATGMGVWVIRLLFDMNGRLGKVETRTDAIFDRLKLIDDRLTTIFTGGKDT